MKTLFLSALWVKIRCRNFYRKMQFWDPPCNFLGFLLSWLSVWGMGSCNHELSLSPVKQCSISYFRRIRGSWKNSLFWPKFWSISKMIISQKILKNLEMLAKLVKIHSHYLTSCTMINFPYFSEWYGLYPLYQRPFKSQDGWATK